MFLGLRTAVCHDPDLERARAWKSEVLGVAPHYALPTQEGS